MRTIKTKKHLISTLAVALFALAALAGSFLINHFLLSEQISDPTSMTADLPTDNSKEKTKKEKAEYTVPPNQPRNIEIKSINVSANIIPLGLLADNTLDAPTTAWDVGWYKDSDVPKDNSGALLLDGHVNNTLGTPGIFYDLHKLKAGDEITLETGNHKEYEYTVKQVKQVPTNEVDMGSMMKSIEDGKQGLNIITCGGEYDHKKATFEDRILVYAVRS